MDKIIEAGHVETPNVVKKNVNVETNTSIKIKDCSVELVRLNPNQGVTVKILTLQTEQDLLDLGSYLT